MTNGSQGYIDGTYGVAIAAAPGTVVNNGQIISYFEKYATINQELHFYLRSGGRQRRWRPGRPDGQRDHQYQRPDLR